MCLLSKEIRTTLVTAVLLSDVEVKIHTHDSGRVVVG